MKNRIFKLIFSLTLLSVLFMIVGCGSGGSQKIAAQASPEEAVMKTFESWRVSPETSPSIVVDSEGNFLRQASSEEIASSTTPVEGEEAKGTIKIRKLYAPDEEPLVFTIYWKNKADTKASIYCKEEKGTLYLTFVLEFDENQWWIEDVIVSEKPAVEGVATYQIMHIKLDETGNQFDIDLTTGSGVIGEKVQITPNKYEDYEEYKDYSDNVESGIIAEDNSLVLKQYYKPRMAKYTVSYKNLKNNEKIQDSITLEAQVGKEVTANKIEKIGDYVLLESESKLTGKVLSDGSLELVLYYQKEEIVETTGKYTIKRINFDTEIEISSNDFEGTIGDPITVPDEYKIQKGYTFLESESDITGKTIKADETVVIVLYFKPEAETKTKTYTIKYLDTEGNPITGYPSEEKEGIVGYEVGFNEENIPPEIDGYKLKEEDSKLRGTLSEDEDLVLTLVYELLPVEYTISGVVNDSNGNILSGATIQVFAASDPNTLITTVTTGKDGSYTITVSSTGKYLLVVSGKGYSAETVIVEVSGNSPNLRANL